MEKAIPGCACLQEGGVARDGRGSSKCPYRNSPVRFPAKVGVVANLRETCVCGAAQRMWENKVHQDALGIGDRSVMDSFRKVGVRYRVSSLSSGELHGSS